MSDTSQTHTTSSTDWEFSFNDRLTWSWRSIDRDSGLMVEQAGDFRSLFDCVKDAERRGYRLPLEHESWYAIPV